MEKYYINYYRKINPNLLNETNGGIGGYTAINKSDNEKSIIGRKISNAIKGRKKPKGFAEHLSAIRKGKNNPMTQRLEIKIGAYKENNLIKSFEYGFEINEFIGSKSAYSNVHKVLTGKLIYINLMDIIGNILNSLRYSQVCDESRNVYARFYL